MNYGDTVSLATKETTYEGILMPRPEMLAKGFLVLKLENGYNIGIAEKDIISSKIIIQHKEEKQEKKETTSKKGKDTVVILSTGGTISSSIDYSSGGVKAVSYTASDFAEMCVEATKDISIEAKTIMQVMSEDVDFTDMHTIAKEIIPYLKRDDVKGIVVTTGTDMLHFISAGLSFLLKDISKPVILTAAQRSIDRGSSDAFMNLSCAITAAHKWDGAEVVTCLHESSDDDMCLLIRGTKVRKMHTSRRDAFRPINILPFAKVSYKTQEITPVFSEYIKRNTTQPILEKQFSDAVEMIYVYPHMDGSSISHFVKKGVKGIVIAGTALGHVPTAGKGNILNYIKEAVDKGVIVVIATQTLYGRTHPFVYTNLRKLSVNLGCLFASDMLPETAYIKLSYLFGNEKDVSRIKELFTKNLRGEIVDNLDAKSFLY